MQWLNLVGVFLLFFFNSWGKSKQYKIHTLIHLTEVTCCGKEMGYVYYCIMAN